MNKFERLIPILTEIALACLAVLLIVSISFAQTEGEEPSPEPEPEEPGTAEPAADGEVAETDEADVADEAAQELPDSEPSMIAATGEEEDIDTTLSFDTIEVTFTALGARIKSLKLTEPDPKDPTAYRFRKGYDAASGPWQMIDFAPEEYENGKAYYALSTGLMSGSDPDISCYDDAQDGIIYEKTESTEGSVTYSADIKNEHCDITVTKKYFIRPDVYSIDLTIGIEDHADKPFEGRLYTNVYSHPESKKRSFLGPRPDITEFVTFNGEDYDHYQANPKKLTGELVPGSLWSGYATNYFLTAVAHTPELQTFYQSGLIANSDVYIGRTMFSANQGPVTLTTYFGPKIKETLEAAGNDFEKALYFGWFTPIALVTLWILKVFYNFVGNWGVSIILVTIIIRGLMFPLTHKSQTSMRAMGKLQPIIKELREKYKDDKERLNREMMNLYKTHKINPAGGCLPLLIQFPIFIAFYYTLWRSIELRHQPFIWWIKDLSAPDIAFHLPGLGWGVPILPFLMGASMYFTQKLTPTNPDPTQQKIMQFMPLFFLFIFISFPSGLVLYWLVSNVLGIGQQLVTNKLMKKKEEEQAAQNAQAQIQEKNPKK